MSVINVFEEIQLINAIILNNFLIKVEKFSALFLLDHYNTFSHNTIDIRKINMLKKKEDIV